MGDNGNVPILALIALALVVLDAVADVLPDASLFWVVTPVRLVIVVGLLALAATVRRVDTSALRWRWPFDLCALALLAAAAIPAYVYDGWSEWRGLLTSVAVAYLAAGVLRSSAESWRAVTLLAFGAVATAGLTGLRQTVQGIPTGFCRGALDGSSDSCGHPDVYMRAIGTFGNPNLLAAFLVLMLPLAVAYAAGHTQRNSRAVAYLVAAAGVAGVLATGSRAGMLALLASLVAFVILRRPTTTRLVAGAAGAVVALTAAGIAIAVGGRIGVRADVWAAAVELVRQHPLGVGVGRTGNLLAARVPGDEEFQHAHNLWLDMLLAAGPVGLLATIGLTVFAAACVIRAARRGSAAGVALGCALTAFAVFCLLDNPVNAIRNATAAWFVLGLAVAAGHGVRHRRSLEVFRPEDRETASAADDHAPTVRHGASRISRESV
ncbi:O-antigen ligase family protein [Mobilicoccus massiliensis]|uniref:O-antigen ligase family protein n=1 Tax=Mobilicoccus massiliensis TaxID=1522310 RepID=UPI00159668C8|nr:O-antigen ligase family protein [Mobilicoccus massiliensis]